MHYTPEVGIRPTQKQETHIMYTLDAIQKIKESYKKYSEIAKDNPNHRVLFKEEFIEILKKLASTDKDFTFLNGPESDIIYVTNDNINRAIEQAESEYLFNEIETCKGSEGQSTILNATYYIPNKGIKLSNENNFKMIIPGMAHREAMAYRRRDNGRQMFTMFRNIQHSIDSAEIFKVSDKYFIKFLCRDDIPIHRTDPYTMCSRGRTSAHEEYNNAPPHAYIELGVDKYSYASLYIDNGMKYAFPHYYQYHDYIKLSNRIDTLNAVLNEYDDLPETRKKTILAKIECIKNQLNNIESFYIDRLIDFIIYDMGVSAITRHTSENCTNCKIYDKFINRLTLRCSSNMVSLNVGCNMLFNDSDPSKPPEQYDIFKNYMN